MKQIPIIKTDNNPIEQIDKIIEELEELKESMFYGDKEDSDLEALDSLTSIYTLINLQDIKQSSWDEHKKKMEGYQKDKLRMYEIIGWVELIEKE